MLNDYERMEAICDRLNDCGFPYLAAAVEDQQYEWHALSGNDLVLDGLTEEAERIAALLATMDTPTNGGT